MKTAALIFASLLLPFHSCSTHKDMGRNQISEGHYRLYAYPEKPKEYFDEPINEKRYKELVFAVVNDTGGFDRPISSTVTDPAQNKVYDIKSGGVSGYKAYFKILEEKFPGKVQIVSSGSMFSEATPPEQTVFFANYLGFDVTGLSRTDFSLPLKGNYLKELDSKLESANFKTVSSNLFNLEAGEQFDLKNILQSAIIPAGGLKIGYISMVAPSMAKLFDTRKLNKVYFQPMTAKTITLVNELRKKGADVIVLMVSHGIDCASQQSQSEGIERHKVNFSPSNQKVCELYENELAQTLEKLPPGMVDLVLTNGMNSKVANVIQGYPTLQNFPEGETFSWARIIFDTKFKSVVKSRTQIMQPVQTCHQFFKETEDCYSQEVLRNIEIIPAKFLGEDVVIQPLPSNTKTTRK